MSYFNVMFFHCLGVLYVRAAREARPFFGRSFMRDVVGCGTFALWFVSGAVMTETSVTARSHPLGPGGGLTGEREEGSRSRAAVGRLWTPTCMVV